MKARILLELEVDGYVDPTAAQEKVHLVIMAAKYRAVNAGGLITDAEFEIVENNPKENA